MKATTRGARWSVILGLTAILVPLAGTAGAGTEESPTSDRQAEFAARYQAALIDVWNGRPQKGIGPLEALVADGGCESHKCQLRLAQAHRYLGDPETAQRWAEAAVERAARVGVTGAEEYNELGLCLFERARSERGYLPKAIAALREAVARHAQRGDTYLFNLSQVLLVAGEVEEASHILQEFQDAGSVRPIIERGEAVMGDFTRLEVIDREFAKYTLEARRQGTEGQILLRAVIDAEGRVAAAEVVHGLPNGLNEAALSALQRSRFQPAMLNGEPVATVYHQSLDMKLTPAIVSQRRIAGSDHDH